ncbi:hypothetical protein CKO22_01310 [Thiococcus pfennigii]|nr:hypothetical protein [Thiococcus pfennigii]
MSQQICPSRVRRTHEQTCTTTYDQTGVIKSHRRTTKEQVSVEYSNGIQRLTVKNRLRTIARWLLFIAGVLGVASD